MVIFVLDLSSFFESSSFLESSFFWIVFFFGIIFIYGIIWYLGSSSYLWLSSFLGSFSFLGLASFFSGLHFWDRLYCRGSPALMPFWYLCVWEQLFPCFRICVETNYWTNTYAKLKVCFDQIIKVRLLFLVPVKSVCLFLTISGHPYIRLTRQNYLDKQ